MKKIFTTRVRLILAAALCVLIVFFPVVVQDQYVVRLGTLVLMYSALALSLNLITGFMGQVSLGHAAFFGVGAYTSAILSDRFEWPFLLTAFCAILVAACFGMLLGIPALKLSGSYLSIVTLGFCEIIRLVELNWIDLTRGPMGMTGIARPVIFGIKIKSGMSYYYLCLIILMIVTFVVMNMMHSHIGRAIMSVREDSIAASAMGVNVFRYKVMTFTISSGFAGLVGAFYAHYMRFIDPNAFNFEQSTSVLSMVILGGLGSIPGSFLGALLLSVIPELLRDLAEARMLIYGLVLVLMMMFRPKGILGTTAIPQLLGIEKKYAVPDSLEKQTAGVGGNSHE
ncbi:branched-chain amino acid ABC transporter permease [Oscillospiraceae bacterium MB08-C2-2]|nr:branched-chain amino acid ABC transporter permease [Oscillospiraceae bacterium MB08-C2-2]